MSWALRKCKKKNSQLFQLFFSNVKWSQTQLWTFKQNFVCWNRVFFFSWIHVDMLTLMKNNMFWNDILIVLNSSYQLNSFNNAKHFHLLRKRYATIEMTQNKSFFILTQIIRTIWIYQVTINVKKDFIKIKIKQYTRSDLQSIFMLAHSCHCISLLPTH